MNNSTRGREKRTEDSASPKPQGYAEVRIVSFTTTTASGVFLVSL